MKTYSNELAQEVYERDKFCVICGSPYSLTIAHIKNKGMGGTKKKDTADNLVCLCIYCHNEMDNGSGKHSKEFREKVEKYIERFK